MTLSKYLTYPSLNFFWKIRISKSASVERILGT